jgi:XTP/dITP diphosphohydrolase
MSFNSQPRKLVFATQNNYKVAEINNVFAQYMQQEAGSQWEVIGLEVLGCTDEIPETSHTLSGNALQKAWFVKTRYGQDCFADDTGLEVDALDGRPGVYSARYAGEGKNFDDNIAKILFELNNKRNRTARFRTIIALLLDGKEYIFEGRIEGRIITERHGTGGFGYDSVFMPDGYELTFAQMSAAEKNQISHRAIATKKLIDFLSEYRLT